MTTEKYLLLLQKLERKTSRGEADWQPTVSETAFLISFSNYSLVIERLWMGNDEEVRLQLRDQAGNVVDTVTEAELAAASNLEGREFYQWLNGVYDSARRRALGIEAALDSVLDDLND